MRAYPAYTAEAVLYMPVQRFWALYRAIPALEASDDLRALMVAGYGANPGEKGQNFSQLAKRLRAQADNLDVDDAEKVGGRVVLPGITPGVQAAEPGSLRAERLAKIEAYEKEKASLFGYAE